MSRQLVRYHRECGKWRKRIWFSIDILYFHGIGAIVVLGAGKDLRPSSGAQPPRKSHVGKHALAREAAVQHRPREHVLAKRSDCELCWERLFLTLEPILWHVQSVSPRVILSRLSQKTPDGSLCHTLLGFCSHILRLQHNSLLAWTD